jgi:hypothetical protein
MSAALLTTDLSAVKPGPISVIREDLELKVRWNDALQHQWQAAFSLDSSKPLIKAISLDNRNIIEGANPVYRCTTGKRTGGWDAFFDFPPANHEGTRQFLQEFHPTSVHASTVGDRVEISFDGMRLGIFEGTLEYIFYPGSALIQQVAVLSTKEPDTAYLYDAGLQMTAMTDRRPGGNMSSSIVFYDATGGPRAITPPYGSERHTLEVHYRALAARMGAGSVAVFPSPHRYLFARDYTTNLGYTWYSSWRGQVSLGVQQPPDDNTSIYPWMNAPPNTKQEMGIFFLLGGGKPEVTLQKVIAYTHEDRFTHLDGFVTFAPHWHFAYSEQAVANGSGWQPPFKAELKRLGVDAAMIMDFHGDGHPSDHTDLRLHELDLYYKACRAQSDKDFLLIPAEEANVILGGHWAVVFPKPAYWMMDRKAGEQFKSDDARYGTVYRVGSPSDVWRMVTDEAAFVYQTHPRTKGSTGYPDKVRATDYFRGARFLGAGWKAMPSDLSSPRLGERAFRVLDDMNNWGAHKITIGEVDVFQISPSDELYASMNVNYLRLPNLPDFDHYGLLLASLAKGDGFISTGEVLLPATSITSKDGDTLQVQAGVTSTFPLRLAEVVWGDGTQTHHYTIDLQSTREFDEHQYKWEVVAPGWTWARFAVWDVAGGGAFSNPTWRVR